MSRKKKVNLIPKDDTFLDALKKGDFATRMSCLLMGFGNIAHKQVIKGLLFLMMEVGLISFFCLEGITCLHNLGTLGTKTQGKVFNDAKQIYEYTAGDNSMLCLLYGVATIFLIVIFLILWQASLKSSYSAQKAIEKGKQPPTFVDDLKALFDKNIHRTLLFLPIVCMVVFTVLPLVFMACQAFTNYDRNHQAPGQLFDWVGLKNFRTVLDTSSGLGYAFWHILGWTFIWAVFATFLNYILGMVLAMIINRKDTKLKKFWRAIFILSIAVPQFVSLMVMRTMLQPEGIVNTLLKNWGFINKSLPFWTNVGWARVSVIVVNLWIGIPFTMMQTTGILQNIPAELYEAAKVDGANAFVIFFRITLPYMLFVTTPYLITQFIGNINNFNVIYLLTKGTPAAMSYYNGTGGKTDLLVTWLYKLTIDLKDYNYGAVISILVFVISAVLALTTYRKTGSYNKEEEFQ